MVVTSIDWSPSRVHQRLDSITSIANRDRSAKRQLGFPSHAIRYADPHPAAGRGTRNWSGRDSQGRARSYGTYIDRMETESGVESRKVMLLR